MPIITLQKVALSFGTDIVLNDIDLSIEKGERLCLTGYNGSGKSTLIGLINDQVQSDDGSVWRDKSLTLSTLEQDVTSPEDSTVYDVVASGFSEVGKLLADYHDLTARTSGEDVKKIGYLQEKIDSIDGWAIGHRVDTILHKMKLPADKKMSELSGGWLKRVAIATSLVKEPDVWLLDEPTNHLDVPTIEWLESVLLDYEGTIVFVSHDRRLMQSVATSIIDIDRGRVTRWDCDYATFLERREHEREVELGQNKLFDDKLKKEEAWIREGIKARRTRNEGRVRALEKLRTERQQRRSLGKLKMEVDAGIASGKIVKELCGVCKSFDGERLVENFDLIIQRGDRVGMLGPNGCGKTTLLNIILEIDKPDSGHVHTGTKLQLAYFDQVRTQLNENQTVADYVSEGQDFITINDKSVHIVSYLNNFMFDADQSRSPIRKLSGGEKNRLLLAKLFSMPANLLVLDEPTNDLDVESLELLEELLIDYQGTVLLVSHDRTFMDNVVSSLVVFEGNGRVIEYVGGYNDWLSRGSILTSEKDRKQSSNSDTQNSHEARKQEKNALRKKEKELEELPARIEAIESAVDQLHHKVSGSAFFELKDSEQKTYYAELSEKEKELAFLYQRWEDLG
jgi:ATP-binding cassette subfamily F protein uup|tara:strand:- start:631 stop:2499 length:1869 start_codon:yes stop_codon:yes gene_type:complete